MFCADAVSPNWLPFQSIDSDVLPASTRAIGVGGIAGLNLDPLQYLDAAVSPFVTARSLDSGTNQEGWYAGAPEKAPSPGPLSLTSTLCPDAYPSADRE